jgi:NTE family protein
MTPAVNRVDLVLEGGGVKGIGLLGALAVLKERAYVFEHVAGASAGAITATLLAAGYEPAELYEVLRKLHVGQLQDRTRAARIPFVGTPLSILLHKAVCEGEVFRRLMTELLEKMGKRTFADLIHPDAAEGVEDRFRYRVVVMASDISCRQLLKLPQSARHLDLEPDALPIAEAVRMSMSLPFVFKPVREVDRSGNEHLIVDGGLLSNFPVETFDVAGEPRWPTFGLLLVEDEPARQLGERLPEPVHERMLLGGLIDYGRSLLNTMHEARDRRYVEDHNFVRTIPIPTLGVRTTEFDLSAERAAALYQSGRDAATKFLDEDWDFEEYKKEFRRQEPPSRRTRIVAELRGEH